MPHHPFIVAGLLGVAVALCLLCAVGVAVVRDPYQRLQFNTPVASVAVPLIVAAVWVGDPQWQSRIKATLVGVVLLLMNAVLSHATARAVRIRDVGHWPPTAEEQIPVVTDHGEAGR